VAEVSASLRVACGMCADASEPLTVILFADAAQEPGGLGRALAANWSLLSTLVHKFGNVFRYAARGRETGVASSFFSRSMRSARVKCQAKGRAMLW